MTLTDELQRQRKIIEAATEGPWDDKPASKEWIENLENNAEFCRESRTAWPRVLEALEVALDYIEAVRISSKVSKYEGTKILSRDAREEIESILKGDNPSQ